MVGSKRAVDPVDIEERDRVFAFLFAVPLEMSGVDSRPPAVSSLVAICLGVFLLTHWFVPDLLLALALDALELSVRSGWQIFSSIFVHWDVLHLLGNLYFLYCFGRLPEARLGAGRFLMLFMVSGVAGNGLFLATNFGVDTYVGGASGAVSGVLGYYLVAFPNHRVGVSLLFWVIRVPAVFYLGLWFYLQVLYLAGQEADIAYAAHVGGFITGMVFSLATRRGSRSVPQGA